MDTTVALLVFAPIAASLGVAAVVKRDRVAAFYRRISADDGRARSSAGRMSGSMVAFLGSALVLMGILSCCIGLFRIASA